MKKIILLLLVSVLSTRALNAQSAPAVQLANKIADKMKDSLQLSPEQRTKIFEINVRLNNEKQMARSQSQKRETVGRSLQRIENTRDSLYRTVLTDYQIALYKQKKRALVSNN